MSRAAARQGGSRKSAAHGALAIESGYLRKSQLPFNSLIFLLPLIILHEVGTRFFAAQSATHVEHRIVAFNLMQDFFHLFGASGRYLPAMAVVGILLAWHIARRDTWQINVGTATGMAVESAILAVPLVLAGRLLARYFPLYSRVPLYSTFQSWSGMTILSLGAGIYEELVFRLIAFTLLTMLLIDLLKIERFWAYLLMVVISAVAFSAYHYLGVEQFRWQSFVFRTVAGLFFGGIFLMRGFGVTAGCHTAYDIFIVSCFYGP